MVATMQGAFFFNSKFFYSKYTLVDTLQLLDAQFNVTNSTMQGALYRENHLLSLYLWEEMKTIPKAT